MWNDLWADIKDLDAGDWFLIIFMGAVTVMGLLGLMGVFW